jgi:hypothetical protein
MKQTVWWCVVTAVDVGVAVVCVRAVVGVVGWFCVVGSACCVSVCACECV